MARKKFTVLPQIWGDEGFKDEKFYKKIIQLCGFCIAYFI